MDVKITLNGKVVTDSVDADMVLLDFCRKHRCYSVKRGCESGNCGLCTVLLDGKPVLSCSTPVGRANGRKVDTLEGLQEEITDLIRVACSDEKIRKLQTGFYDVVLDSEATGLLVHEFIGHLFEADNELIDKNEINSNKTVAIPQVTVIDDPTLKGGFGTYRFDDEGTVARATQIIKNGKMNSLLHSQKTGQLAGVASTSNARAIDYTQLPLVRMSNTYMLPDSSHTPKDLIQSIEYGIYAKGTRDSKSGINAVAGFREMYLVKDGEIGECIANMNIIGTPLSILGKIQMIANDFNIFGGGNGGCIKKGQGPLNVSSGGPHVKLHNVMLFPRLNDSFKSNNQV